MRSRRRLSILSALVTAAGVLAPISASSAAGVTGSGLELSTVAVVQPTVVVLASPANGSQVGQAVVPVSAVGTVDPTAVGVGFYVSLLVDGQTTDTQLCPSPAAPTCAVTLSWDTTYLTGTHTLQAQFSTYDTNDNPVPVLSAPISVTVHVSTSSKIGQVEPVPYGHTAHLSGEVVSATGTPLAGVPVQVTRRPSVGKPSVTTVATDALGDWSFSYKAKVNTSVIATVAESPMWGGSHASTSVKVYASGRCVTKSLVDANAPDSMVCSKTVPALAKGTKVQVQLLVHGKWHTLVKAKVSGAKFTVAFRLAKRGTAQVRLYLPATKALTSSETSVYFIAVV